MHNVNRLGLLAVIATFVVVFAVFGAYKAVQSIFFDDDNVQENEVVADATAQQDPNEEWDPLIQNLYRNESDAKTQAVPEVQPLTQEEVDAIKEQLDVPDESTYTGRYLAELPSDMPQEDVLDKGRITQFVNANKGQTLPTVSQEDIVTSEETSPEAIKTYLESISPLQNPELKQVTSADIEQALATRAADSSSDAMDTLIQDLTHNRNLLREVVAPAEVVDLHVKLVAASEALLQNVSLLNTTTQDFIGGLIAAKRIETLGDVFRELDEEIKRIEEKYSFT